MENNVTAEINYMVELLPEQEQRLVLEIVKRFIPDDVATPDDIAAIKASDEDARLGRTVRHEDINWD